MSDRPVRYHLPEERQDLGPRWVCLVTLFLPLQLPEVSEVSCRPLPRSMSLQTPRSSSGWSSGSQARGTSGGWRARFGRQSCVGSGRKESRSRSRSGFFGLVRERPP